MSIFLLGFMGSGKSAVARSLARELRWPLLDLDALIEAKLGVSIADFFDSEGESAFRAVETEVLKSVCGENAVISLGGGVPTQLENRILLQNAAKKGALVAYLQTSPAILAARIRRQPGKRPLIDGDGLLDLQGTQKRVEALLKEREGWYLDCANFRVSTDTRTIPQIARVLASRWKDDI